MKKSPLYQETDWNAQCQARCRKSGKQCPHTCKWQIPNQLASSAADARIHYTVLGPPVNLCVSHALSWHHRSERLLTLPVINGGHLSPVNQYGYGSIVICADRIDFSGDCLVKIPKAWGATHWAGAIPAGLLEKLGAKPSEIAPS